MLQRIFGSAVLLALVMTGVAHARLQSGEGGKPPKVTGKFEIARLVYGRHIQMPEMLVAMNRSDRSTRAAYDPARDKLLVDITVQHTQPLHVRNNFLDAELSLRAACAFGPDVS